MNCGLEINNCRLGKKITLNLISTYLPTPKKFPGFQSPSLGIYISNLEGGGGGSKRPESPLFLEPPSE